MKKTIYLLFITAIIPALFLSACGTGKVSNSNLPRIQNPQAPATDLEGLVSGNTAFAFDLYQAVRLSGGNLVYSPYSISLAFAMAYAGAAGDTASQMANVLHYDLPDAQFHAAFNALDQDLAGRPAQVANVAEEDRFQLSIANALWGQQDRTFLPAYLDLLAVNYGAGMHLVDFIHAPDTSRQKINNWVSDQTRKLIQDLFPEGSITPDVVLVLANAIYFKATWQEEFLSGRTNPAPFHLLDGGTVDVPMMAMLPDQTFPYAAGDGWQAIALPYKGSLVEMFIIVPDLGTFNTFEPNLTAESYQSIYSALKSQPVNLSLPKFKFDFGLGLKDVLVPMGMQDAFQPYVADFSGMDGSQLLFLSNAFHKAFIAVDEKGTEAAAATGIIAMPASVPQGAEIRIDRPFLFFIRDVPTGTLLFMGRVVDPR
jgi:serpin B